MEIKECKRCGGDDFIIEEIIVHEAGLCPKDKDLTVYKVSDCRIIKIACKKCNAEYSEHDFKTINFS